MVSVSRDKLQPGDLTENFYLIVGVVINGSRITISFFVRGTFRTMTFPYAHDHPEFFVIGRL